MNTQEIKAANALLDFAARPPKGKVIYQNESVKIYENSEGYKSPTWAFTDLENWV